MSDINPGALITEYKKLKAALDNAKKVFEEKTKPIKNRMDEIKLDLKEYLLDADCKNISCDEGTAYRTMKTNVSVADKQAFFDYCMQGNWHVADVRAMKSVITEMLDEDGEVPPGVKVTRYIDVNIR